MAKITARKTGGFGEYCWTVFIDGKAFKSDIHKVQVSYYKDLAKIEVDKQAKLQYNTNTEANNLGAKQMDIRKLLRECGEDMAADMGGVVDDTMAYDMAGCLLEDPQVFAAAKKMWPGKSKAILQEIMADCI